MKNLSVRDGAAARTRRGRCSRPALEGLEGRVLLYSATGDHFAYGGRITWSVMPDGTPLGGYASNLVSALNSQVGPASATWLPAVEDAFAQWEAVAGVNFAQVPDSGQPFGYGNIQQGSPGFGDIRIGGMAQGSNILAFAMLPPAANGGSDSGDILLNTAQSWRPGGYDLETVLVHEIGHALGLGHSADPRAAMYAYYGGAQDYPNTDDIAGAQSIWGPRQEDPIAQGFGNHAFANAYGLNNFVSGSNDQAYVPGLDVASSAESYWFKVTTPPNASGTFTAQVQSGGLSELSPWVEVFSASEQGLASARASASTYGATVAATVANATPNTTYYIRVVGSNAGVTGVGSYALTLDMGSQAIAPAGVPNTLVYAQPDQGGGAELMVSRGLGSWIKEWAESGGSLDLSSLGIKPDPDLDADLESIAAELATSGALAADVLDAAVTELLEDLPLDGSYSTSTQSSELGHHLSAGKLQSILARFLDDLQSILCGGPDPGPSPASSTSPPGMSAPGR